MNALSSQDWKAFHPHPQLLPDNKQWHVFISYRSANRTWVIQLYDILTELGYKCYVDQFVAKPSDNLPLHLQQNLRFSWSGIVLLSETYKNSMWCKRELEQMDALVLQDPTFRYCVLKLDKEELPPELISANSQVYLDFSEAASGPYGIELLRLLYFIQDQPLPPEAVKFGNAYSEAFKQTTTHIRAAKQIGNTRLLKEILESDTLVVSGSPVLPAQALEALIDLEAYDVALPFIDQLIANFSKALRPKQLKGLTLARQGKTLEAQLLLETLYQSDELDPETLGILARTWMDRYHQDNKRVFLERARKLYEDAFEATPTNAYVGINAASKSIFLDDIDKGKELANRVLDLFTNTQPRDYWEIATLGEAHLILGNFDTALNYYREAIINEPFSKGSHSSTLKQALLLADHLAYDSSRQLELKTIFDLE